LIYVALSAIALSRFGLWMSDSGVSLLLQQTVASERVSTVNGSLHALYSLWSAIALIVTIFTPVSRFIVVVGFSYGVVALSFLLFAVYCIKEKAKRNSATH